MSIQNISSLQSIILSALNHRASGQPRVTTPAASTPSVADTSPHTAEPATTTPTLTTTATNVSGVASATTADPTPSTPAPTPSPTTPPTRGADSCDISREARCACDRTEGVRSAEHSGHDSWQIDPERAARLADKFAARAERLEARAQKMLDDGCDCNDARAQKLMKRADRAWALAEKFAAMIPGNDETTTPADSTTPTTPVSPTTPAPPTTTPTTTTPGTQATGSATTPGTTSASQSQTTQTGTLLNLVG